MMRRTAACLLILFVATAVGTAAAAERIAFLVAQSDTYVVTKGLKSAGLPPGTEVRVFTPEDLAGPGPARDAVAGSGIVVVDVMIRELVDYLLEHAQPAGQRIYALRGSRDDAFLRGKGFVFDDDVQAYYDHFSSDNIAGLLALIARREIDPATKVPPPRRKPTLGIRHPDARAPFAGVPEYLRWYQARGGRPAGAAWIAIMVYDTAMTEGHVEALDTIVRRLEAAGHNVVPCFGTSEDVLHRLLLHDDLRPRLDLVLAFSLKFRSALGPEVLAAVARLDVPVINAISTYYGTVEDWRADPRGLAAAEVAWAVANPEISGLIEPSVLSGKTERKDHSTANRVFYTEVVADNLEHLLTRIDGWANLRRKPAAEKKVAILFYNNSPGKQGLGASYLNVFESLESILARLRAEGYRVDGGEGLTREAIRDLIVRSARNVGSWAPGELEELVAGGHVARLPLATYEEWFSALPDGYRDGVREQWGSAADSDVMIAGGQVLIPAIRLGNVVLMPEPSRGYSDDPRKLYHSPTLFPHHQYTAAYLWIERIFGADARIHLGTHGTLEWLPGKQAGLSTSCPPEVLGGGTPSVYPYIVDDVGEGIQAKRRGRAVVVDHLVPPLRRSGMHGELRDLAQQISQYRAVAAMGGETAELKLESIRQAAGKLGITGNLKLTKVDAGSLPAIENYLVQIGADFLPYGLHTFGRSPEGEPLTETIEAIREQNPKEDRKALRRALESSGGLELDRLVAGLAGRFVPAGRGNDPLRAPESLPTGKNFYGFDPDRLPSREGFELGRRAAEQLIAAHLERDGTPPSKVALVLWATETIRSEGINESTALWLMGMRPVWDKGGRVTGTEVVPGAELGRPRVDVLINPSGLYRDLFPNMMNLLDEAVQRAAVQTDVANLIAAGSAAIRERLVARGVPAERADALSRLRIFSEKPGNYGNRVVEVTGASALWESDTDVSKVYERHTGYAYGAGEWGTPARELLGDHLETVDTAVHSISSALYGTLDNDDMFQFLGGLSLAVRNRSGRAPDTVISMQRRADEIQVEDIGRVIGRELHSRYLNPAWVEGMQGEDYAGAREMSNFVDYLWGWQVTTPDAVDDAQWDQTYEVYVEDKHGLGIKDFLDQANPWAFQSIAARMLESARKDYWKADDAKKERLATEYVRSVLAHGASCSDNTCANPLLHAEVIDIATPLLSPELIERFKAELEKATHKTLEQQRAELEQLRKELREGFDRETMAAQVDGFRMEEIRPPAPPPAEPVPGARWWAAAAAALICGLILLGFWRARKRR
jgi:cobaltochelatase CobN